MPLFEDPAGPIVKLEWGEFHFRDAVHGEVKGVTLGAGKDIRVVEHVVTPWAERKGHLLKRKMISGIDPGSVEVLVIGTGVYGRLRCPKKLRRELETSGLHEVIVLPTPEACATYNRLVRQGRRVALLAHGTC